MKKFKLSTAQQSNVKQPVRTYRMILQQDILAAERAVSIHMPGSLERIDAIEAACHSWCEAMRAKWEEDEKGE